jgi:hypothetical protein
MFSFFSFGTDIKFESEKKLAQEIISKIEQDLNDPKIAMNKKKKKLLIIKSLKYYFSL